MAYKAPVSAAFADPASSPKPRARPIHDFVKINSLISIRLFRCAGIESSPSRPSAKVFNIGVAGSSQILDAPFSAHLEVADRTKSLQRIIVRMEARFSWPPAGGRASYPWPRPSACVRGSFQARGPTVYKLCEESGAGKHNAGTKRNTTLRSASEANECSTKATKLSQELVSSQCES